MSLSLVRSTLMSKLATWAAAQSPVITIAREGVPFPAPPLTQTPETFIEAFIVPSDTVNWSVSATNFRELGEFVINIWTRDDVGPKTAEDIVASLAAYFPIVPKSMLPLSVETTLSAKRAIPSGDGYRVVPCSLSYRMES